MPSPTKSTHHLLIDGLPVTVTLKNQKNMYLRVRPGVLVHRGEQDQRVSEPTVDITAPYSIHLSDVEKFVRSRRNWIEEARDRIQMEAEVRANSQNPAGPQNAAQHENLLGAWPLERENEARAILETKLPPILEKWQQRTGRAPSHVTLRHMKTRWGSCTPATGRIRLNLALAYVPDELLEYVLVHELTHLDERGHGAGFQRRLSAYLPDWKEKRRALNSYGSY
ncbi:M48 family metallopeptidase [Alloscardovia macacae]|uniref:Metal-dependent hydrolase n=1 Tax=Alloscardovia macacae TaxID=1160091 RepID=A0A261F7B5_9BIFI|nr:YgjP-like metallopeptidase domain-containing protein [Alloscardovia macacae]OZG54776.1 metal-dependent hydrolase [Alloscardovia macacae]